MHALAITSDVTLVPATGVGAVVAIVATAVGLGILLTQRQTIGQTTLTIGWWWTLVSLLAWSSVEIAAAWHSPGPAWLAPLRLAAISLSFCPVVALLGAKRPQHRAWNLVVLSLWAIVALPAAEAFFLTPGRRLELGPARGWFLWVLILLLPINFVPTRYWLASLLVAAGQIIALGSQLALVHHSLAPQAELVGLVACACGLSAAWLAFKLEPTTRNRYDRLWLDFRDSFGLFWSLRVRERVNAAARQFGWDVELTWRGFRRPSDGAALGEMDAGIESKLRTTLKGLLRRFVSSRWIAERLKRPLD